MRPGSIVGTLAVGLTVGVAACGSEPAQPQQATAAAAATAAEATVRGDLLKDWQRQRDTVIRIAEAMPEGNFGYRATPAQRTYGEQVMHIAMVNLKLLNMVGGQTPAPSVAADSAGVKADALKALAASYDYGTALLNEHGDASITETVEAGFLGPSTRARIFWFLLGHSMDIYGQMAVYLRLNDIVPPASRGD